MKPVRSDLVYSVHFSSPVNGLGIEGDSGDVKQLMDDCQPKLIILIPHRKTVWLIKAESKTSTQLTPRPA